MRGARKTCQSGSNFDVFFGGGEGGGVDKGISGAIISLPGKCHLNAISLVCQ